MPLRFTWALALAVERTCQPYHAKPHVVILAADETSITLQKAHKSGYHTRVPF